MSGLQAAVAAERGAPKRAAKPAGAAPADPPGLGLDGTHPIVCFLYTWALLLEGKDEKDQPPHDAALVLTASEEDGSNEVSVARADTGAAFARLKVWLTLGPGAPR